MKKECEHCSFPTTPELVEYCCKSCPRIEEATESVEVCYGRIRYHLARIDALLIELLQAKGEQEK